MTQDEVDKLLKRDAQVRAGEIVPLHVARKATPTKIINFAVDETLYAAFKDKATLDGFSVPAILRGAVISYTFGGLEVRGDRLKSKAPEYNSIGTVLPAENTGIPGKRGPKAKEPVVPMLGFDYILNNAKTIWDFKMYKEPHVSVDSRPHLAIDTQLNGQDIEDIMNQEYDVAREPFTKRDWDAFKFREFVACCVMKFFALNKEQKIRYDEDSIQEDMTSYFNDAEMFFVEGKLARGEEIK